MVRAGGAHASVQLEAGTRRPGLHVTYNAMQAGWRNHEPQPGGFMRAPKAGWTELDFEYSALVVLRSRGPAPEMEAGQWIDEGEPWEE